MYSDTGKVCNIICTPAIAAIEALAHGTVTVVAYHKQMVLVIGVNNNLVVVYVVIGNAERLCALIECMATVIGTPKIPTTCDVYSVGVSACELVVVELLAVAVKDLLERSALVI